jgi:hypothetical protein
MACDFLLTDDKNVHFIGEIKEEARRRHFN